MIVSYATIMHPTNIHYIFCSLSLESVFQKLLAIIPLLSGDRCRHKWTQILVVGPNEAHCLQNYWVKTKSLTFTTYVHWLKTLKHLQKWQWSGFKPKDANCCWQTKSSWVWLKPELSRTKEIQMHSGTKIPEDPGQTEWFTRVSDNTKAL